VTGARALPDQMCCNTGSNTSVWILTNGEQPAPSPSSTPAPAGGCVSAHG
jgi:hypothetical protein